MQARLQPNPCAPRLQQHSAHVQVWHKSSGYIALVLSIATIVFGTRIIPVDNDIYRTTFTVLWVTVACIAIYLKFVDEKFVFKKVPSSATSSAKPIEAELSEVGVSVGGPVGQGVAETVSKIMA